MQVVKVLLGPKWKFVHRLFIRGVLFREEAKELKERFSESRALPEGRRCWFEAVGSDSSVRADPSHSFLTALLSLSLSLSHAPKQAASGQRASLNSVPLPADAT